MYKYETHLHTKNASACARRTPAELIQAFKKVGYAGFIITDHFIKGNTCVPKNLDWETRMRMYWDVYLEAKEEGKKVDFDVFFGIEHLYEKGKEVLIYGIDLDFLLAHPELNDAPIDVYANLVHEAGGILIHAHPHRVRPYIDPDFEPRYDLCDGIEVYNTGDSDKRNNEAYEDAIAHNKLLFSGGDIHELDSDERISQAGFAFERRLTDIHDFVNAVKNREGYVLIHGEKRPLK